MMLETNIPLLNQLVEFFFTVGVGAVFTILGVGVFLGCTIAVANVTMGAVLGIMSMLLGVHTDDDDTPPM